MQSHHINCASCLVCLAQTMKFSGNDLHRRAEESGRTSGSAETRQVVDGERHWRSGRAGICVDVFLEMPCQTKGSPCAQEGFFFWGGSLPFHLLWRRHYSHVMLIRPDFKAAFPRMPQRVLICGACFWKFLWLMSTGHVMAWQECYLSSSFRLLSSPRYALLSFAMLIWYVCGLKSSPAYPADWFVALLLCLSRA